MLATNNIHLRCLIPLEWKSDNEYSPSIFELSRIMNVPSFEYFLSFASALFLSKLPWYQDWPTGDPWGRALGGRLGMIGANSVCTCVWEVYEECEKCGCIIILCGVWVHLWCIAWVSACACERKLGSLIAILYKAQNKQYSSREVILDDRWTQKSLNGFYISNRS